MLKILYIFSCILTFYFAVQNLIHLFTIIEIITNTEESYFELFYLSKKHIGNKLFSHKTQKITHVLTLRKNQQNPS